MAGEKPRTGPKGLTHRKVQTPASVVKAGEISLFSGVRNQRFFVLFFCETANVNRCGVRRRSLAIVRGKIHNHEV